MEGIPIVIGATAWDDPSSIQTHILVIYEAIYFGTKLYHSLTNSKKVTSHGLGFWDNLFDK